MRKNHQDMKKKFRTSKEWKEFRQYMRDKQKTDPVTGQKLTRMANLHHMNLDETKYTDLSKEEDFVFLNHYTHKMVHWLFSKSNPSQWRDRIEKLIPILEHMEKVNAHKL